MTTVSTPTRRALDYRTIEEVIADVERLRDRGYERAGRWTLAQNCDHNAIFIKGCLDGFTIKPMPWIVRKLIGDWFVNDTLRKRKFTSGLKVPASFLPEEKSREDRLAADEFIALLKRFRDHTGKLHPSPMYDERSKEVWTQMLCIHAAHHMSFLIPKS